MTQDARQPGRPLEGFFLVDEGRRVVGWSPGAGAILGPAADEAVGKPCHEITQALRVRDPLPCGPSCQALEAARRGRTTLCLLRWRHTLGTWSLLHEPLHTRWGFFVLHRIRDVSLEVISLRFLRRVVETLHEEIDEIRLARAVAFTDQVSLTRRERQVLSLLAEGLDTRGIATRLGLSYFTSRNYVQNVLAKLDAHNRVEALLTAQRLGLVPARSPADEDDVEFPAPPPSRPRPRRS